MSLSTTLAAMVARMEGQPIEVQKALLAATTGKASYAGGSVTSKVRGNWSWITVHSHEGELLLLASRATDRGPWAPWNYYTGQAARETFEWLRPSH